MAGPHAREARDHRLEDHVAEMVLHLRNDLRREVLRLASGARDPGASAAELPLGTV